MNERPAMCEILGIDPDLCELCEEPLDGRRKWRRGLDGAGAHESCLKRYL